VSLLLPVCSSTPTGHSGLNTDFRSLWQKIEIIGLPCLRCMYPEWQPLLETIPSGIAKGSGVRLIHRACSLSERPCRDRTCFRDVDFNTPQTIIPRHRVDGYAALCRVWHLCREAVSE
jgi:hypothetical protein